MKKKDTITGYRLFFHEGETLKIAKRKFSSEINKIQNVGLFSNYSFFSNPKQIIEEGEGIQYMINLEKTFNKNPILHPLVCVKVEIIKGTLKQTTQFRVVEKFEWNEILERKIQDEINEKIKLKQEEEARNSLENTSSISSEEFLSRLKHNYLHTQFEFSTGEIDLINNTPTILIPNSTVEGPELGHTFNLELIKTGKEIGWNKIKYYKKIDINKKSYVVFKSAGNSRDKDSYLIEF